MFKNLGLQIQGLSLKENKDNRLRAEKNKANLPYGEKKKHFELERPC